MYRSLFVTLLSISVVFGAPTGNPNPAHTHQRRQKLSISSFDGETLPNSYIVKLKPDITPDFQLSSLVRGGAKAFGIEIPEEVVDLLEGIDQIGDIVKKIITHELPLIGGYAGVFTDEELQSLLEDENVESVEPNGIMNAFETQRDATWGLQSISSRDRVLSVDDAALTFTYNFDESAGEGVDIYILDTGINVDHVDFEDRATFGWAAPSYQKFDGNGHGTHCAGSAAGKKFGVAKKANLIGVKVLSDDGAGSVGDIIAGIQYVMSQATITGKPTVASMSLGGGQSSSLDQAVNNAISQGIHFTVAAGNENQDAGNVSPARVVDAITVGAITSSNAKAGFSNFGSVVDVFAPGQNIVSTWIRSNTDTNTISGTSMATPHVAGLAAYLLGLEGNMKPDDLSKRIKALATKDVITGLPDGTPNLLAFNGFGEASSETSGTTPDGTEPETPAEVISEPVPPTPPAPVTSVREWWDRLVAGFKKLGN